MLKRSAVFLGLILGGVVLAQESGSFKLKESVFNLAGHPSGGSSLVSPTYRITLDSLGEGVIGAVLQSPSYRMDGGFGLAYPPPGEIANLRFPSDQITLQWDPERSVGAYELYRGLLSTLSGLGYGTCEQHGIATAGTTVPADPAVGDGYFYLVTARNHLSEEGTKGFNSSGMERANPAPCP